MLHAAEYGKLYTLKLLIHQHGASLDDVTTDDQRTAVHMAVQYNQIPVLEYLVNHHPAHIERVTTEGYTPLHEAASSGSLDSLKILLDAGAKVNVKSNNGYTPLDMAKREDHSSCVVELEKR